MKIVFLDAKTIGEDLDLSGYEQLGEVVKYGFSTNVRFNLCPYSAAQHPVQCKLQALVGSIKISHGMLQSCTSLILRMVFVP